jgi:cytochrome c oxidase subunit 2
MLAKLIAVTQEEFDDWVRGKELPPMPFAGEKAVPLMASSPASEVVAATGAAPAETMADKGRKHFEAKACITCHSVDGSQKVGPSFKGLWGRKEVVIVDGKELEVTVDENYVRESIENPNAKLVKGFGPVMPTYKGLISEAELNELMAYLKTL